MKKKVLKYMIGLTLLGFFMYYFFINYCIVYDCLWDGKAIAWLDYNENGIREVDEPGLSGVTFHIDDVKNNFKDVSNGISEQNGEALLFIFLWGCPEVILEIYPEPVPNYKLTTLPRIRVKGEGTYQFGFIYSP